MVIIVHIVPYTTLMFLANFFQCFNTYISSSFSLTGGIYTVERKAEASFPYLFKLYLCNYMYKHLGFLIIQTCETSPTILLENVLAQLYSRYLYHQMS